MKLMHSEWRGRLDHWLRTLKDDFYQPLGEISLEAYRTMEQLSLEEAQTRTFTPVEPGFTWGDTWEYCWFRGRFSLPQETAGKRIVMDLKPGGESALFVNGRAFGGYRASWVDEPYQFIEDNLLTPCAEGRESYELVMETYAGHFYPKAPLSGSVTGPVLPGAYTDPGRDGERSRLGKSTYGIWNEAAYQLYMDADTLKRLLDTLDETSLRAAKIAKALERFTLTVDFEQPREQRIASYLKAREELRPLMEAKNGSTVPVFYAVGHAHLDLAYLWPMAETYRKTERTFAAQVRLLEEYPEYRFIQSQPAAYEMCRKYYPELFERVREAVKGGRWIADGAMWVEPDTNMTGGESLIRQLIHGKRYFREMFDRDSRILWLPDSFGYTAALPQILKGCGVDYLVTQKIFWSYNEGEQFPYHYFAWQGMDGSQVDSFLPTGYNYRTHPTEANHIWKERAQLQDLDAFLMPFGYGDGGGGPARDFVEYARRQEDLEGSVKVKIESPLEFFEDMKRKGGPVNTYVGEMYFSAHRGTYTSQAAVKKNNRLCELAMREAELWSSLALGRGLDYGLAEADALWKEILLHQFHDILPGSCIGRVYEEAKVAHAKVLEGARALLDKALETLADNREAQAVTVWNSLSFEREVLAELPESFGEGARTLEGKSVPVQRAEGKVKALVHIPSCGAVALVPDSGESGRAFPEKGTEERELPSVSVSKDGANHILENSKIKAVINCRGEVTSFVWKETGREFAAGALNRLHLYKDVPRMFDAWDIDSNYVWQEVEALTEASVETVAEGLEGVLRVSGRISKSTFVQYIRLAADSRRIVFETEIDWRELHRLLKTAFPVTVYTENGINEIQFGYVERPTHRSRQYDKDRFEVCNHRYSALCDGFHGAAVLNDCKYGISMNGNALELTLLRASTTPEMRADNGLQTFTYAFTAWEGSFGDCDVVRQGYELNVKPPVTAGAVERFSGLTVNRPNIILDTMKPAEDGSGDVILRLYESKRAACEAEIGFGFGIKKAWVCDMLEHCKEEMKITDGKVRLSFRAFEIKTIRVARKPLDWNKAGV